MAVQNKIDSKKAVEEWKKKQLTGNEKPKKLLKKVPSKETVVQEKNAPTPPGPVGAQDEKSAEDMEKKPRVDSGIVEDGIPQQEDIVLTPDTNQSLEEMKAGVEIPQENLKPNEVTREIPVESAPKTSLPPEPVATTPPTSTPKPATDIVDEKQALINVIDEEASRRKKKPLISRKSSEKLLSKEQSNGSPLSSNIITPSTTNIGNTTAEESKPGSAAVTQTKAKAVLTKTKAPMIRPKTSLRPPSVRPASARPGAPRKREPHGQVEVVVQANENVQLGDINVKVEQFKATSINSTTFDDDEEDLIVIEDVNIQDTLLQQNELRRESDKVALATEDNQGQLVKQILESQKEFESTPSPDELKDGSLGRGNPVVIELRDQIQKLTKSVQPLAKFMDFLLEDIDSMQREHEMWQERSKDVTVKLAREKNATQGTVVSLRHQLEELEIELQEKRSLLFTVRENILHNEERVLKLFKNL